tara:strand:- start:28 stop:270 length:243 start_codon:yes stop_codon:yes gene_type:complete
MQGEEKITKLTAEAFEAFERIKPIIQEYFDGWVLQGRRAGCGTKIVLGDISKGPHCYKPDMRERVENAKEWKEKPLEDTR